MFIGIEVVIAATTINVVKVQTTKQLISPSLASQYVFTGFAFKQVTARSTKEAVVPVPTGDRVGIVSTIQTIISRPTQQLVATGSAMNRVVLVATGE